VEGKLPSTSSGPKTGEPFAQWGRNQLERPLVIRAHLEARRITGVERGGPPASTLLRARSVWNAAEWGKMWRVPKAFDDQPTTGMTTVPALEKARGGQAATQLEEFSPQEIISRDTRISVTPLDLVVGGFARAPPPASWAQDISKSTTSSRRPRSAVARPEGAAAGAILDHGVTAGNTSAARRCCGQAATGPTARTETNGTPVLRVESTSGKPKTNRVLLARGKQLDPAS